MNKVAVTLRVFEVNPGLSASTDSAHVRLVLAEQVTQAMGNAGALYDIARKYGKRVDKNELEDCVESHRSTPAGTHTYHEGVLTIPEGMVAVRVVEEDISTRDDCRYEAFVIDNARLKDLYERRAAEYAALAAQCE